MEMQGRGHQFLITARQKDVTEELLQLYGLPYTTLSAIGRRKSALFTEFGVRTWRLWRIARKFKPDLFMGIMGASIAPLGKVMGIPSFVFYDTENAKLTNGVVYKTCTKFITPHCYRISMGKKHETYRGFHELAYLHPSRFQPDESVLAPLALKPGEPFSLLRFVSWGASHDFGHKGITFENKCAAVNAFKSFGKVFISSENPLEPELEPYRLNLPPHQLHHVLAYATLLYGESATLASEGAMLGTTGIYIDDVGRGYTSNLEEEFGLVFNYTEALSDQSASIEKGLEILKNPASKAEAKARSQNLIESTVDVTQHMMDLAESV